MGKRVLIASDHGGFELKRALIEHLRILDYEVVDLGTEGPASVDYPDFAGKLCKAILAGDAERGILICGTGIGMSITANKFKGIYAALCTNEFMARMARNDNDSNVLCLGGRVLGGEVAKGIVEVWLNTSFGGGRHARRTGKIRAIEKEGAAE
ncbi:MAG: ribose 5-phosphate isomerase B [Candidatus Coatesbacteria bacterium]|nr:MAG: ribose 5-phosphate isomerase B [Candidatus Coatesbacteria bacterium]